MKDSTAPVALALPPPGQPLDRGATSLGLILLVFAVMVELPVLLGGVLAAADADSPLAGLVALLGAARVCVDVAVGGRLASGAMRRMRDLLYAQAILGVLHAALVAAVVPPAYAAFAFVVLAAFPVAVPFVAYRRRFADAPAGVGRAQGAVVATLAGVVGLYALAPLVALVAAHVGRGDRGGSLAEVGVLIAPFVITAALLLRTAAAWRSAANVARALQVTEIATALVGSLLVLAVMVLTEGVGVVLGALLAAVILLLRFGRRIAARDVGPDDPEIGRGAARLTIAWLLLGQGLLTVAHPLLPAHDEWLLFLAGGWTRGDVALHGAIGALEVWAACELLAGTRRSRLVAATWAIAAMALVAPAWLATWETPLDIDLPGRTAYSWTLLVLPIATLAVLRRPYIPLTVRVVRPRAAARDGVAPR